MMIGEHAHTYIKTKMENIGDSDNDNLFKYRAVVSFCTFLID